MLKMITYIIQRGNEVVLYSVSPKNNFINDDNKKNPQPDAWLELSRIQIFL